MAYFGGIFFANMGGGGGQNYFQLFYLKMQALESLEKVSKRTLVWKMSRKSLQKSRKGPEMSFFVFETFAQTFSGPEGRRDSSKWPTESQTKLESGSRSRPPSAEPKTPKPRKVSKGLPRGDWGTPPPRAPKKFPKKSGKTEKLLKSINQTQRIF